MRALRKASRKIAQETVRPEIAVDLLIIEHQPAQALEALILAVGLELTGTIREIGEADRRLRKLSRAMHQHWRLAHFIDFVAIFLRARLSAGEKVDKDRRPIRADQFEHQRDPIGITGLGKAIELVFRHRRHLLVLELPGPAALAYEQQIFAGHGFAFEAAAPGDSQLRQDFVAAGRDDNDARSRKPPTWQVHKYRRAEARRGDGAVRNIRRTAEAELAVPAARSVHDPTTGNVLPRLAPPAGLRLMIQWDSEQANCRGAKGSPRRSLPSANSAHLDVPHAPAGPQTQPHFGQSS
jgi:hypothetical protein